MRRRAAACAMGLLLWAAPVGAAQLLALVAPQWSAFQRSAVPAGAASLVAEARALVASDPTRVAEVLAGVGTAPAVVRGLAADAGYFLGGDSVFAAQRTYGELLAGALTPEEQSWVRFMLGNIHKGLGFLEEAEAEYRAAAQGPPGPWSASLAFDLAVLDLERERWPAARDGLSAWVAENAGAPGEALAMALLAEAEVALDNLDAARGWRSRARSLDPDAWRVRPETGMALAELARRDGDTRAAVQLLDAVAELAPGSAQGARARLAAGAIWEEAGAVADAVRVYAVLLDGGATAEEGREARLRLALLGVAHAAGLELTEPYPAYRVFYRPQPTLEEFAAGRDPAAAQRALRGLATLAFQADAAEQGLHTLARVFQDYPESAESGRAYEAFMDLLAAELRRRLGAGQAADVVRLYAAFRPAVDWAPTRDVGTVAVLAAQACEALGATGEARSLYEEMRAAGSRVLSEAELRARSERTRAVEGDLDAIRAWARRPDAGWRSRYALGMALAAAGDPEGARAALLEAARLAAERGDQLELLAQADRFLPAAVDNGARLRALLVRRQVWREVPPGADRAAWEPHLALSEARLRVAAGDFAGALRAYRAAPALAPEDRYLLALAEARSGDPEAARRRLAALAGDATGLFSRLATLHLDLLADPAAGGEPR